MNAPKYRTLVPDIEFWMRMIPCQAACPAGTDAGRYVGLIGAKRYDEAYAVAAEVNPFPSVCGWICTAPCDDEAGVLQHPQVLHHAEARHLQLGLELRQRAAVTREEPVEQEATRRVGQRLEHTVVVGHGSEDR